MKNLISASVGADGSTGDTVLTHGGPGQGGASVSVEAEVVGGAGDAETTNLDNSSGQEQHPQQQILTSGLVSQSSINYSYCNPLYDSIDFSPHNTMFGNQARDGVTGADQSAHVPSDRAKSVRRKPNILLSRTLDNTGDY